ncbi:MAG: hypothetical protein DME19_20990, partial [Verrucomicrobia bacterium]
MVPNQQQPPAPPTISPLPHQFTDEDVPTTTVNFTIGPESSLPNLSVTAEASNLALTPLDRILISGDGTNYALTIVPAANQFGTSLITVRVTDAADQSASSTFLLTVNAVNDPPTLEPIPNQITYENSSPLVVPFHASDVDSPLTYTMLSSNPDLISTSGIRRVRLSLTQEVLEITPRTNRVGSTVVTLTASDGAAEVSASFVVSVLPRPFVPTPDRLAQFSSGSIRTADLDGDGRLDLLLTGNFTSPPTKPIRLYRNMGAGRFVDAGLDVSGAANSAGFLVDYDHDGDIDVILTAFQTAQILRNEGGTNFTVITNVPNLIPTLSSGAVGVWGDVDNDGDLDMVYSRSPGEMGILLNNNGVFNVSRSLPRVSGYLAVGDYDSDGMLDIAFSGSNPAGAYTNGILRGVGGGQFQPGAVALDQSTYGPVGWCDIDMDGRLDFWHLQFAAPGRRLLLYRNLGGGEFAAPFVISIDFLDPASFHWADLDGDGDLDFVVEVSLPGPFSSPRATPVNKAIMIYRNDGDFQFTPLGDALPDAEARFLSIGDFDNDGDVDLTAAVWEASPQPVLVPTVRVLLNQISRPNPPPGPPTGLQARVDGQSVWLSWRPATDFNQPGGLTYNVRVGTRPGASDIVPAMSLTNGARLVVEFGNAGPRTNFFLTNLIGETLYWSVQSVDNSYIGGPFAQEQRFIINLPGNQAPVIGPIGDQTIREDSSLVVPFSVNDDRTPADMLRLRAIADNPFLLPSARMTFGGSGTNRTLAILPATNQIGQTLVTVEAWDAVGAMAARSFTVTVTNVNDPPFISAIAAQTNLYSAEPLTVEFMIGDPETAADQLQLNADSSDPILIPSTNIVFSGSGANRSAAIRTGAPVDQGQVTITLTVTDPDGANASTSFALTLRNERFRLLPTPFGGVRDGSMAWGDFDNDGDLDLALAGQGLNQTALYRNDGGGRFVKLDLDLPNVDGGGVEWGDFDNDGDLDLLIHGRSLFTGPWVIAYVYRNLGGGKFELMNAGLNGLYGPAAWGDYDNDGRLDILSTGEDSSGNYRSVVYHNEGDGHFAAISSGFSAIGNAQLNSSGITHLWCDFNSDGYLDLILRRFDVFQWRDALYRGDGHGGFSETPVPW